MTRPIEVPRNINMVTSSDTVNQDTSITEDQITSASTNAVPNSLKLSEIVIQDDTALPNAVPLRLNSSNLPLSKGELLSPCLNSSSTQDPVMVYQPKRLSIQTEQCLLRCQNLTKEIISDLIQNICSNSPHSLKTLTTSYLHKKFPQCNLDTATDEISEI